MIALAILASMTFTACEKDEDENQSTAKPAITGFELGLNNSNTAYKATDLHIEANIVAEGKIKSVTIDIHPEGDATWDYTKTYSQFAGLKNTLFHEHINIPAEADTGEYHFHFSVIDQEGNSTEVERELEIKAATDNEAPLITIESAPSENERFATGDTIRISGTVADNMQLGGMYIGLVKVSQKLTNQDVNASNTITVLHTHDFDSYDAHSFSSNIIVGASMDNNITPKTIEGAWDWESTEYYILVKSKDESGNWAFSDSYSINISID